MDVNARWCKKHCNTACTILFQSPDLGVQAGKRLKVSLLASRHWVYTQSLSSDRLPSESYHLFNSKCEHDGLNCYSKSVSYWGN